MSHNSQPKTKHLRSSIACDNCRKRKSRCDSASPTCGQCTQRGEVCVYTPLPRETTSDTRFAAVHRKLDRMEEKFDRLEAVLGKLLAGEERVTNGGVIGGGGGDGVRNGAAGPVEIIDSGGEHSGDTGKFKGNLLFNDRLAIMKAHTVGGQANTSIYMSSVFLSILSPEDISSLAFKLGDPMLPQRLEASSHQAWWDIQNVFVQMFGETTEFEPSLALLEASIRIYTGVVDMFVRPLMPVDEVGFSLQPTTPEPLKKGQLAAIILIGCIDIKLRKDHSTFSEESIEEHERAAVCQAIRTLNFMRFSPPGFLEIRLSTLLVFILLGFAVPCIMPYLDMIVDMSKAIGLDNPTKRMRYDIKEAEWRERVWYIVCHITYNFRIMLSQKPPAVHSSTVWLQGMLDRPEMLYFKLAQRLDRIYEKSYPFVFSPHAQKCTTRQICDAIVYLDKELTEWREAISDEDWTRSYQPNMGIKGLMELIPLAIIRIRYHYILLALHSIPAFHPDQLPDSFPGSLAKVSGAAREICKAGVDSYKSKGQCTLITVSAVTTAVCTLLYKQLRYPTDHSNHEDINFLRTSVSSIHSSRWPYGHNNIPSAEIWNALVDIMGRHYELCNVDIAQSLTENNPEMLPQEFFQNGDECNII